jgi:hypothetical protein
MMKILSLVLSCVLLGACSVSSLPQPAIDRLAPLEAALQEQTAEVDLLLAEQEQAALAAKETAASGSLLEAAAALPDLEARQEAINAALLEAETRRQAYNEALKRETDALVTPWEGFLRTMPGGDLMVPLLGAGAYLLFDRPRRHLIKAVKQSVHGNIGESILSLLRMLGFRHSGDTPENLLKRASELALQSGDSALAVSLADIQRRLEDGDEDPLKV